jgi:hypothetical protein
MNMHQVSAENINQLRSELVEQKRRNKTEQARILRLSDDQLLGEVLEELKRLHALAFNG